MKNLIRLKLKKTTKPENLISYRKKKMEKNTSSISL